MKTYTGSSGDILVVIPHDTDTLKGPTATSAIATDNDEVVPTRAVFIGGAGNLNVITAEGQTVLITAPAVGVFHPIAVVTILSTSTTATPILACW